MTKLLKNKKGSALITVTAILMIVTILTVGFGTVALWSYKSTSNRTEDKTQTAYIESVAMAIAKNMHAKEHDPLITRLFSLNEGEEWRSNLRGEFTLPGGDSGYSLLYFKSKAKDTIVLETHISELSHKLELKKSTKSYVVTVMEKIYENSFFFEGGNYWNGDMSVTGNIFINGSGGLQINAEDGVHNGNVIACGNLEINKNSTINGEVTAKDNLTLNSQTIINGNVIVGGNLTMTSGSKITGDVLVGGNIVVYEGGITGTTMVKNNYDIYSASFNKGQIYFGGNMLLTGSRVDDFNTIKNYVDRKPLKDSNIKLPELPTAIETQEWKIPKLEDDVPIINNHISTSGILNTKMVMQSEDLVFDTSKDDLHILIDTGWEEAVLECNVKIDGSNRVFIYLRGSLTFKKHAGKIDGFDPVTDAGNCKLFIVSDPNKYSNLHVADGARLDGYVYLQNGEFRTSGRGIFSNSVEYKIVGSVAAKTTSISRNTTGEFLYCQPNLGGIHFNETQYEEVVDSWQISYF